MAILAPNVRVAEPYMLELSRYCRSERKRPGDARSTQYNATHTRGAVNHSGATTLWGKVQGGNEDEDEDEEGTLLYGPLEWRYAAERGMMGLQQPLSVFVQIQHQRRLIIAYAHAKRQPREPNQ
jgi:hypothetical protein